MLPVIYTCFDNMCGAYTRRLKLQNLLQYK